MSVIQTENGKWQVDIRLNGRGSKRVRKTFSKKVEAEAWKRHVLGKAQENTDWAPAKRDARRLTDLVEIWYASHGTGLRAGKDTQSRLIAMCEAMGNPRAESFTAEMFATYRAQRI